VSPQAHALLQGLLSLAPALALLWCLALGRYPGEQLLVRRRTARQRRRARPAPRLRRRGRATALRGPVLAWELAGRAPPAG
jgi:hypothetical protein